MIFLLTIRKKGLNSPKTTYLEIGEAVGYRKNQAVEASCHALQRWRNYMNIAPFFQPGEGPANRDATARKYRAPLTAYCQLLFTFSVIFEKKFSNPFEA